MATARQALRAARMHADDLAAHPNVVGVGTGPVDDDTAQAEADHAVVVYVSRKVPPEQLGDRELLPAYVEVPEPSGAERVPVVVVESGVIEPEAPGAESARDQGFASE